VEIASEAFAGLSPLARHRAIYDALGALMTTDIHALSIRARAAPDA
jgi:BolA protein